MKTKHFFNAAMAAFIAVIFSALAGCASTGAVTADTAAKLAVDINAIKAGCAVVEGGTVRLTDGVGLKKALTVPEGVTLDLTAGGVALELRDGAVLTVNGTVNATGHGDHGKGWVEGSLRIGDGAAAINGSGTLYLKSKGRLLNIGGGRGRRQFTLDGVTLVGLPDNDNSLIGIGENGGFVLKGGAITGNTRTSDDWAEGGGVEVWRGTFTMTGGTISGNTAIGDKNNGNGGGVIVSGGSTFTMQGGAISGNTAQGGEGACGGGMRLKEDSTFTMTGGAIMDNIAQGADGLRAAA